MGTYLYVETTNAVRDAVAGLPAGSADRFDAAYARYRALVATLDLRDDDAQMRAYDALRREIAEIDPRGTLSLVTDHQQGLHSLQGYDVVRSMGQDVYSGQTADNTEMRRLLNAQRTYPSTGRYLDMHEYLQTNSRFQRVIDALVDAVNQGAVTEVYWA